MTFDPIDSPGCRPYPRRVQASNGDPPRRPAVFLTDFVDVGRSAGEVAQRVCGSGEWMMPLAGAATAEGDAILVRLGPGVAGARAGVVTRIHLGECLRRNGQTFVPMRWEAAAHAGLFPVLDGDVEIARLDASHCRVAIKASYRPPLEALGRLLDAVALHRVAESTVRAFLHLVADHLEEPGNPDLDERPDPTPAGGRPGAWRPG